MTAPAKPIYLTDYESPEIFQLLVDAVRDYAIYVLDPNGIIRSWNEGARRAKQYEDSEIIGKSFSLFYTEEDRVNGRPQMLLELSKRDGRVEDQGWRVRKDGTRFWADVVITPLYDKDGVHKGFAKITRDMTERRNLETALEDAVCASQTKSAFLANMSHELRTPLTAIIGYAEMIHDQLPPGERDLIRDDVSRILYSARHLQSIVSDILDLSKIEAGCLELHEENVDLAEIANECIDTVTPLALRNRNAMISTIPGNKFVIKADRTRLRQILYNLLSNAAKFTHEGKIIVGAHLLTKKTGQEICLDVTDTGVGMTDEQAAIVFERFRQLDNSHTERSQGGTGLGLAICSMLTNAMNGRIAVQSKVGEGSTFRVCLPGNLLVK